MEIPALVLVDGVADETGEAGTGVVTIEDEQAEGRENPEPEHHVE